MKIEICVFPNVNKFQKVMQLPITLTPKEIEILLLLIEGKPNKQISDDLYISLETTKKHIQNIYKKLGINCKIEAFRWLMVNLYPNCMNQEFLKNEMMKKFVSKRSISPKLCLVIFPSSLTWAPTKNPPRPLL